MKNSASIAYACLLIVGDFVAILGAFTLAYILRVSFSTAPFVAITARDYLQIFILLSPLWIVVFGFLGLYHRDTYEWRWREISRLFVGSLIGIMAVITYDFIVTEPIFPARIIAVYGFIIAYGLLIVERSIMRTIRHALRNYGWGIVNTMIIGNGVYSTELFKALKNEINSGYRVVAYVGPKPPKGFKGSHFVGLESALEALENLDIHAIILTELFAETDKNSLILSAAQENHCAFKFIPAQEGLVSNTMEVELFQGMPVVAVHQTALTGWGRIAKRLFDIVTSLFGLIILSPMMLFIYILLSVTGGKAIYRRQRLTRFGSSFSIYKFRTLKIDYNGMDPEEGFTKMGRPELIKKFRDNGDHLDNDPRISKLGRFLRSTSLDELPQLYNILRGDISLVGPRALIAEELQNYPYKNLILSVKSGLTGLAQVSGRRDIPFEERRKLDLYYVQNWSFWLDLKIMYRTFIEIFHRTGAK